MRKPTSPHVCKSLYLHSGSMIAITLAPKLLWKDLSNWTIWEKEKEQPYGMTVIIGWKSQHLTLAHKHTHTGRTWHFQYVTSTVHIIHINTAACCVHSFIEPNPLSAECGPSRSIISSSGALRLTRWHEFKYTLLCVSVRTTSTPSAVYVLGSAAWGTRTFEVFFFFLLLCLRPTGDFGYSKG